MTDRHATRTWRRDEAPPAPIAQVADPAMRAILRVRRRALLMELAEIDRRCPVADEEEDALTA